MGKISTIKRRGLFIIEQSEEELYVWFKGKLIYKRWTGYEKSMLFDLHGPVKIENR